MSEPVLGASVQGSAPADGGAVLAPSRPQLLIPVLAGWQRVDVDPATAVATAQAHVQERVTAHPDLAPLQDQLLAGLLQSAAVAAELGTSALWVRGSGTGSPEDPLVLSTMALGFMAAPTDPGPLLDAMVGHGRDDPGLDDDPDRDGPGSDDDRGATGQRPAPDPWHRVEVPLGTASRRTLVQAGDPDRLEVQWALSLPEWGVLLVLLATSFDTSTAAELTQQGELVLRHAAFRPADWQPPAA